MPELDPTAPLTAPAPDLPTGLPQLSRRQALAMGGGLAAAAAVMGAGLAAAQTATPDPSASATPPATPTSPPATPPADPGLPGTALTVESISLEQAQGVLQRAEARAREIGVAMNIVIIDVCGDLKAAVRQDTNGRASLVLAPLKAQTALAFRQSTAQLATSPPDRVESFVAAGFTVLGGGLPIRSSSGAVIGAIGVGGGSPLQDIDVARAGLGLPPEPSPSATPTPSPSTASPSPSPES